MHWVGHLNAHAPPVPNQAWNCCRVHTTSTTGGTCCSLERTRHRPPPFYASDAEVRTQVKLWQQDLLHFSADLERIADGIDTSGNAGQRAALSCLHEPQRVLLAGLLASLDSWHIWGKTPGSTFGSRTASRSWTSPWSVARPQSFRSADAGIACTGMHGQVPPCVVVMCHTKPMPKRGEVAASRCSRKEFESLVGNCSLSCLAGDAGGREELACTEHVATHDSRILGQSQEVTQRYEGTTADKILCKHRA